ncbi:hypothetical protein V7166_13965 [Bacillus thuringiensis]
MRFYVADNTGYINEMLSFVFEDMDKYNWIFADMVPHVFKDGIEVTDTIFEQEKFYISGKELYSFLIINCGKRMGLNNDKCRNK